MIHYPDLTELELEMRALLTRKRSDFERRDTPFSLWAAQVRAAWAQTREGKRAIAECESKAGKVRRTISGAPPGGV